MSARFLALAPATRITVLRSGARALVRDVGEVRLPALEPRLRGALLRIRRRAAREDAITDRLVQGADDELLARWFALADTLGRRGALECQIRSGSRTLVRAQFLSPLAWAPWSSLGAGARRVLSRFACLRRDDNAWILETARSAARVRIADARVVGVIAALAHPCSATRLARFDSIGSVEVASQLLTLLDACALTVTPRGARAEWRNADAAQWEFADALIHSRSRLGSSGYAVGAMWPHAGRFRSLPALKPPMSRVILPLRVPRGRRARSEPDFTRVLEARRSEREYAARPIDIDQLGEFLYLAARVKSNAPAPRGRRSYQQTLRPSAGGGACHELEVYVLARRCQGLEPGLFHYDPAGHLLEALPVTDESLTRLLDDARAAVGGATEPQVLLLISARFARVSWKYSGMAYATVLKDVGALYQTMYLVATAMGLAACALGTGDSLEFAKAIGVDPLAESSVGEFLLGRSRRPSLRRR